jgi:hypothetical protein
MFLTEAEARTKWCPHAVASHTDPRRGFRKGHVFDDNCFACIASGCSQWRAALKPVYDDGQPCGTAPTDKGYCGLAGRPEGQPT